MADTTKKPTTLAGIIASNNEPTTQVPDDKTASEGLITDKDKAVEAAAENGGEGKTNEATGLTERTNVTAHVDAPQDSGFVPSSVKPVQDVNATTIDNAAVMDTAPRGDTELRMRETDPSLFEENPDSTRTLQDKIYAKAAGLRDNEAKSLFDQLKAEEDTKAYYYRRGDIRDFRVAGFHFNNHILKIVGEKEHDRFIEVMKQMPEYDLTQIMIYRPELYAEIEKPLGNSPVFRGVAGSGNFIDPRVVQNPRQTNM